MVPVIGSDLARGVRSVFQQVVVSGLVSAGDGLHLSVNGNHRVTKSVQLVFGFALGRLDHHRSRDRPGNRGSVKPIIHQTLCHVFYFDAGAFPLAQINDAFVRNEAVFALEQHGEIWPEPFGDVIGVEDGDLAGAFQSLRAHHADVHPGDNQNARAAPGRGGDVASLAPAVTVIRDFSVGRRAFAAFTLTKENAARLGIENKLARKIGRQVFGYADWTDTRPAAAVRDAKCFVQIQMADIRAVVARATETDLRIHVGAIHVTLPAVRVHDVADFADGRLEDAVRGWVRDH